MLDGILLVKNIKKILLIGASGTIGRALIKILCNLCVSGSQYRIVVLQYCEQKNEYEITTHGFIDLTCHGALSSWLKSDLDAIVFMAGFKSELSRRMPKLSLAIHLSSFLEILDWALACKTLTKIIYASSTAALTTSNDLNLYGVQKRTAESALEESELDGFALRFPTVMPRSQDPSSLTYFLNNAFRAVVTKSHYIWPININREIRIMSSYAAARHIYTALGLSISYRAINLDLPATVVTPSKLCDFIRAPDKSRNVQVIPDIDEALINRPTYLECFNALNMGFNAEESLDELITNIAYCLNI